MDNVESIIQMIRLIPSGKVATYGQIARLAGIPKNSRQVGYVLRHKVKDDSVPWYRVVNSKGEISERKSSGEDCQSIQRQALEQEGIEFSQSGKICLKTYQWASGKS